MANDMGRRYKTELEKSKSTIMAKLQDAGSKYRPATETRGQALSDSIIKLIARTSFPCPIDIDMNNDISLRKLCLALLETLDDRMMQLRHQRLANKHILNRFNEFQLRIAQCPNGDLILNPSVHLLKGYSVHNVDSEQTSSHNEKEEGFHSLAEIFYEKKEAACNLAVREDVNIEKNNRMQNITTMSDNDGYQPTSLKGNMKVAIVNPHDITLDSFQVNNQRKSSFGVQ